MEYSFFAYSYYRWYNIIIVDHNTARGGNEIQREIWQVCGTSGKHVMQLAQHHVDNETTNAMNVTSPNSSNKESGKGIEVTLYRLSY